MKFLAAALALSVVLISVTRQCADSRSIVVRSPTFELRLLRGTQVFRVRLTGELSGSEAIGSLGPFEYALFTGQSAAPDNHVTLTQGLFSVSATLVELQISRP